MLVGVSVYGVTVVGHPGIGGIGDTVDAVSRCLAYTDHFGSGSSIHVEHQAEYTHLRPALFCSQSRIPHWPCDLQEA